MMRHGSGRTATRTLGVLLALLAVSCGGGGSDAKASCTTPAGQVTMSAGGSVGSNQYPVDFGSLGWILFNNLNLTFYTATPSKLIVDSGVVCLDAVTSWPGGTTGPISVIVGDTYVVQLPGPAGGVPNYWVKFVVKSYSGGVVTLSYVPHL
jgi:hypothetical protein